MNNNDHKTDIAQEQDNGVDSNAAETRILEATIKDGGEQQENAQAEIPSRMPLLAVRDIVVFNYMILPLFVGRDKSIKAVEAALNDKRYLLINTQKDEKNEDP